MSRSGRLFFSIWYYFRPPWDSGITPPELVEFVATHPPGRALDLGCGTGTNSIYLAQKEWEVIGIDFAARAISKAKNKLKAEDLRVDFRVADVTEFPRSEDKFDLVLDIGCFHSLDPDKRRKYMENLRSGIRISGTFLIYAILGDPSNNRKPGIQIAEFNSLESDFTLVSKREGLNLGTRPSVWLEYLKI